VGFPYLSRVAIESLDHRDYPSDRLICKLAKALDGDAGELLILDMRLPPRIRRRMLESPDAFLMLADLDDEALESAGRDRTGGGTRMSKRRCRSEDSRATTVQGMQGPALTHPFPHSG
jgi:hypothetical protein